MLVPYGVYCALFVLLALMNMSYMARFGTFGFANFLVLALFLAGTIGILYATAGALYEMDWTQPIVGGLSASIFSSGV